MPRPNSEGDYAFEQKQRRDDDHHDQRVLGHPPRQAEIATVAGEQESDDARADHKGGDHAGKTQNQHIQAICGYNAAIPAGVFSACSKETSSQAD